MKKPVIAHKLITFLFCFVCIAVRESRPRYGGSDLEWHYQLIPVLVIVGILYYALCVVHAAEWVDFAFAEDGKEKYAPRRRILHYVPFINLGWMFSVFSRASNKCIAGVPDDERKARFLAKESLVRVSTFVVMVVLWLLMVYVSLFGFSLVSANTIMIFLMVLIGFGVILDRLLGRSLAIISAQYIHLTLAAFLPLVALIQLFLGSENIILGNFYLLALSTFSFYSFFEKRTEGGFKEQTV